MLVALRFRRSVATITVDMQSDPTRAPANFTLNYDYGKDDFRSGLLDIEAHYYGFLKVWGSYIPMFVFGGIFTLFIASRVLAALPNQVNLFDMLFLLIGISFLVLPLIMRRNRLLGSFAQAPNRLDPTTLTLSDDAITFGSVSGATPVNWTSLREAIRTTKSYIFVQESERGPSYFHVPRRAFGTDAQEKIFNQLVAAKVPVKDV
jgi:hypothetical protein